MHQDTELGTPESEDLSYLAIPSPMPGGALNDRPPDTAAQTTSLIAVELIPYKRAGCRHRASVDFMIANMLQV